MKFFLFLILMTNLLSLETKARSRCFGKTSNGRLEKGVKLPSSGNNFKSYSLMAGWLGRTYVHSEVKEILLDTYKALEKKYPDKVFMYAETGFKEGGQFKPHKTHQNGLSLDHMVPVTKNGKSTHLPTHVFNKFGYSIEFDQKGKFKDYVLDYEALGSLIKMLDIETKKRGHKIWRVIFDPKMTPSLLASSHGAYLKKNIVFSKRRSWVRHDEHIHVDFLVPCQNR